MVAANGRAAQRARLKLASTAYGRRERSGALQRGRLVKPTDARLKPTSTLQVMDGLYVLPSAVRVE
ncbi:MAG: hypothetical protein ACRD2O_03690 [Terriglobia bacterium]